MNDGLISFNELTNFVNTAGETVAERIPGKV